MLGLISTKSPQVEDREMVLRRIEQAAAYLPIEQLALSPQCGFASDLEGNPLSEDVQWRKLELVRDIAETVWSYPPGLGYRPMGGSRTCGKAVVTG